MKPVAYTVPEAAKMLGISKNRAYVAAANGDIPTIRIGRLLRVPVRAFERLLDGHQDRPTHKSQTAA